MIKLTVDEVVLLHEKLLAASGGSPGLRDRGLLESAVWSVDAAFGEVEQYPAVEEKAARLAFALVANHAFVDGNKRVGMLAMLVTLELNGITLRYAQEELIRLGLDAAAGRAGYEEILAWVRGHRAEK